MTVGPSRSAVWNSGWLMMSSVFMMAVGVVVTAVSARYFGPATFGELNYAVALVSLFAVLSTLGLDSITVKNLVDEAWDDGIILCTSFVLRLLSGAVLIGLSWLIMGTVEGWDERVTVLVLIMSLTTSLHAFQVVEHWMQAHLLGRVSSLVRMSTYLATSAFKILIVATGGGIVAFAWAYVLDAVLFGAALTIAYFRVRDKTPRLRVSFSYGRNALRQSGFLILSGSLVSLYNRVDQVMLGALVEGTAEVGIYAAGVTLAEMWYFVPHALILSLKPGVFARRKEGGEKYEEAVQTMYGLVAFIGVAAGLLITLVSGPIVSLVYGPGFAGAGGPLAVLVWAGTFAMLGVARSVWLLAEGLQRYSVMYTVSALVVNVVLNWLLIPAHGAMGAAYATVAAQITNIVALSLFPSTRASTTMIARAFLPTQMLRSVGATINALRRR